MKTTKKNQTKSFGINIFDIFKKYPDELSLIKDFIRRKYPHGVYCRHCGSVNVSHRTTEPKLFHCHDCVNSFSIFTTTIFENTKVDLRKWVYAIHFMVNAKKGVSACQLHRGIGGSYKTAWRMMHQIRKVMNNEFEKGDFDAIVEVDETYIGGKPQPGEHSKRGRGTDKTPVVGVYDRKDGVVHAKVAIPNKKGQRLTGKQLLSIIEEVASQDSEIHTDEFRSYRILTKEGYKHMVVNHSIGEYVKNKNVHVNSVESFWSLLKRGIIGSFHQVSEKYLQAYVNEFTWRYNNRNNQFIFDDLMNEVIG